MDENAILGNITGLGMMNPGLISALSPLQLLDLLRCALVISEETL